MPLPEPVRSVYLEVPDEQSEFAQALRASLRASGARLLERPDPAGATSCMSPATRVTERVLTVSTRNIPTDYELTYDVNLRVDRAGGELIAPDALSLSRIYSFDETKLLAKEREKQILLQALARDMAGLVLRRLASLQYGRDHAAPWCTGQGERRCAARALRPRAAPRARWARTIPGQLLGRQRGRPARLDAVRAA